MTTRSLKPQIQPSPKPLLPRLRLLHPLWLSRLCLFLGLGHQRLHPPLLRQ